jgi:serine/threonine protein kinase
MYLFDPDEFVVYHVHDSDSGETRRFIGPPLAQPVLSLHGRSTRGTPVYDVKTRAVCWLKDTWRINSDKQPAEGKTYELLHEKGVSHIAKVIAHGDVPISNAAHHSVATNDQPMTRYQTTRTDLFCQSDEGWCTLRPQLEGYIHYRIVLDMVGREYTSFKSTMELLSVTIDAIRGVSLVVFWFRNLLTAGVQTHGEAYEKAGILHRDISPGNIMITEDGRGFLIDWDLAKSIHGEGARSLGRTVSATKLYLPRFH